MINSSLFLSIKKGRVTLSPREHISPGLLEYRGDIVGVVGFVRFGEVALTAELRRRCSLAGSQLALQVRVVRAVDEEVGGIELAAAVSNDRARCTRGINRHHVLVVAGGANHIGLTRRVDTIRVRPFSRCQ